MVKNRLYSRYTAILLAVLMLLMMFAGCTSTPRDDTDESGESGGTKSVDENKDNADSRNISPETYDGEAIAMFSDDCDITSVTVNGGEFIIQPHNYVKDFAVTYMADAVTGEMITRDIKNLMITGVMDVGTSINSIDVVSTVSPNTVWAVYADKDCAQQPIGAGDYGIIVPGENILYIKVLDTTTGYYQIYTLSVMGVDDENRAQYEKWGIPTLVLSNKDSFIHALQTIGTPGKSEREGKYDVIALTKGEYYMWEESYQAFKPYLDDAHNMTVRSVSGNPEDLILRGNSIHKRDGYNDTPSEIIVHIINGSSNITFYGIKFAEANVRSVDLGNTGTENITIDNCHHINIGEFYIKSNNPGELNNRDLWVKNLVITNNLFMATEKTIPSDHQEAYNGNYMGAIDLMATDGTYIADNIFMGIQGYTNGGNGQIMFWGESGHFNSVIERNVFIECDEGISFGLTESISSGNYAMENAIVRNNFIYNCFSDEIEFSNSKNIEIYNNTIIKSASRLSSGGISGRGIRNCYGNSYNIVIKNNIVTQLGEVYNYAKTPGGVTGDDFLAQWGIVIEDNLTRNDIDLSTYFANLENPTVAADFMLTDAAVNAIGKGQSLEGLVDLDFFGNARTGIWDIGAHQYSK